MNKRNILIYVNIIALWICAYLAVRTDESLTRVNDMQNVVDDRTIDLTIDLHNTLYDSVMLGDKALQEDMAALELTLDLSVLDSCGIITNGFGHGSVVAIESDLLLTAGHCIGMDGWIEVGGVQYEIIEQWASEKYDVGFVRIEGSLPYVELGNMPELLDEVYLVGSPYETGFVDTITKGIVSHLDRDRYTWEDLIQTDAEGAPGSSGCPLFNKSGQIIGICVSGPNPGGGVTLCVPVTDILAALKEYRI